jgi:predicted transcriptional regulator
MTASSSVVQPVLQLRLPRDTHRKLSQLARAKFLTKSAFARQLLLEQLALVTGGDSARRRKMP